MPGFQSVVQNNRLNSELNRLVADLHLARMEAIKRNDFVTVCKRNADGSACILETTGWELGWLVFVDSNSNGVVDAGEEIIRVHSDVDPAISVKYTVNRVTLSSQGFAYGFSGTFTVSDSRGNDHEKKREISNSGRISIG